MRTAFFCRAVDASLSRKCAFTNHDARRCPIIKTPTHACECQQTNCTTCSRECSKCGNKGHTEVSVKAPISEKGPPTFACPVLDVDELTAHVRVLMNKLPLTAVQQKNLRTSAKRRLSANRSSGNSSGTQFATHGSQAHLWGWPTAVPTAALTTASTAPATLARPRPAPPPHPPPSPQSPPPPAPSATSPQAAAALAAVGRRRPRRPRTGGLLVASDVGRRRSLSRRRPQPPLLSSSPPQPPAAAGPSPAAPATVVRHCRCPRSAAPLPLPQPPPSAPPAAPANTACCRHAFRRRRPRPRRHRPPAPPQPAPPSGAGLPTAAPPPPPPPLLPPLPPTTAAATGPADHGFGRVPSPPLPQSPP
ncbi:hypothetical protein BU14_0184s0025 [Porphyra umbilicalis]|uniref:Uncharacterized protein n=1 Tax=Porphyra umbilicalis TaxID=2786 RepID=A0A1X6P6W4_PORUM|nr:hypothetical protein BU14_0184s0025 [Porphyra umbilicalis]|eukprot:OSX76598.1 hypothetical protein BU14_0184s0025 [Porphyra umbilicalis]